MKTLRYAALALAVSGVFTLGARAGDTTNNWWNVDFQALEYCDLINQTEGPNGAMVVLTNTTIERDGREITHRTWEEGEWVTLDGDETIVTNSYFPTNTYKAFGQDTCLKLDTQGNDLTWTPAPTSTVSLLEGVKTLVDADLYLVGSDSPPDTGDFDAAGDVQTAIYLKNETDEDSGETTNSVLCVYAYDSDKKANYWQELKGVEMADNAWFHVQVLVDHSLGTPMVRVYVNNTQMSARDGDTVAWTVANTDIAQAAKKVSSVSFRGTGAVDNFVGRAIETTYDSYNFTAQVYMNGTPVAQGTAGNVTRVTYAEAGEGQTVPFSNFYQDDLTIEWPDDEDEDPIFHVSYYLSKIVFTNFVTGTTRTFNYSYSNFRVVPATVDEDYVYLSPDGEPPYSFSVMAPTEGATADATIVNIYFENVPAEGDFKLTASQNVGEAPPDQTFNTNSLAVDETTFTFAQSLTDGGTSYILSTITVGATPAGIVAAVSGTDVVVTVPLNDQIAEGVYNVATATYVEGSLADGEELQGSRDGNVYTYTKHTPPVAIIIAGAVTNNYDSLRGAITNATAGDTIYLLRDDHVSFSADAPELMIDKEITIDGGSNTLYGVSDHACATIADRLNLAISGNGDVTIKDLKFAKFSDTATVQYYTYPVWVRGAYGGTLTLDGVTITDFSRTAVNISGGTVVITNCVFTGDTTRLDADGHAFQGGVEVGNGLAATVTIADTVITGMGSVGYPADSDSDMAAAVQMSGVGTITIENGTFAGQYSLIVSATATGGIVVNGGDFDGDVCVENGDGTLAIHGGSVNGDIEVASELAAFIDGGWFKTAPAAAYIAAGYEAKFDDTNAPRAATQYKVAKISYTLTYVTAQGTAPEAVEYNADSEDFELAAAPATQGWKFLGWVIGTTTNAAGATYVVADHLEDTTATAAWEENADPIAVNPGDSLTAADKTNGDLPIEVTNAGFVVKFRSSQPNIVYQLVASDTINPADWTACPAVGDPVTSAADTSEQKTQLIMLTAPMSDNVKFFKIKASVPAGN